MGEPLGDGRSEQQRGELLTLSQYSTVRHQAATETGWENKQSAQWQNLWLGQKAEAVTAAETKAGRSESCSVHIGKLVHT